MYSLEAPCRGASNEYTQHMFLKWYKKIYPRIFQELLLNKSSVVEIISFNAYHAMDEFSSWQIGDIFSYFSKKIGSDTSCKLSSKDVKFLHVDTKTLIRLHRCAGLFESSSYHNNLKYLDRQTCTNSVDPDQMPQDAASDLGLHCLPFIQQFLFK